MLSGYEVMRLSGYEAQSAATRFSMFKNPVQKQGSWVGHFSNVNSYVSFAAESALVAHKRMVIILVRDLPKTAQLPKAPWDLTRTSLKSRTRVSTNLRSAPLPHHGQVRRAHRGYGALPEHFSESGGPK